MAMAIPLDSPDYPEFKDILFRFADHSKVCDVCSVKTFRYCKTGGLILHELAQLPTVKEVPEDFGKKGAS